LDTQQAEVIAFLKDAGSYPGSPPVTCIETHGNLVFLSGDQALKIKRAVRFPYMDYSTLEKRRLACHKEVDINRRFSPDIYLGVLPIRRDRANGGLTFEGDGAIVEWAVRMRRFDQRDLMSAQAQAGDIPDDMASELADVIHDSHVRANRVRVPSGADRVLALVRSVMAGLSASQALDSNLVGRLEDRLGESITGAARILDERGRTGFVRRCHGDLHLANIVLWHGRPALYDAIEFDDEIATIDTLYGLAFVLMDLSRYRQRRAANIALNRYLWNSRDRLDLEGLVALPGFMGLRAAIRCMVAIDRAAQEDAHERKRNMDRAHGLLCLALDLIEPSAPCLIAIGGVSGTGKTTLARTIAPYVGRAAGAVHVRSDLERKAAAGVGEFDRLPADSYSHEASDQVYARVIEKARLVLSARYPVVVDAVFAREELRRDIEAVAAQAGVPFKGIWLQAGRETKMQRVAARRHDASDATPEVVAAQLRSGIGRLAPSWATIGADGARDEIAHRALSWLGLEHGTGAHRRL
jgi:aminoglycoside phosphotransferase family enzyme/predicted kinase